jgi:RNA polymerase sigma factor (sigma-70 family)
MNTTERQTSFLERLERHRGIIVKVATAYCRNGADREDLAQEIVAQLWRSYARYDESRIFSTWMYRVAMNVAISFSRRQAQYRRTVDPTETAMLETLEAQPADEGDNLALLHGFIAKLDVLNRALIVLYLDDIPYAEIAQILGLSETNVATKIARIKQRLKRDVAGAQAP